MNQFARIPLFLVVVGDVARWRHRRDEHFFQAVLGTLPEHADELLALCEQTQRELAAEDPSDVALDLLLKLIDELTATHLRHRTPENRLRLH